MDFRFLYYLPILLFLTDCKSNAQVVDTVRETITMTFVEDTLGHERFWLKKKDFGGLYFEEDAASFLVSMDLICENELDVKIPDKRVRFYDLPEYQNQSQENKDYYTHSGGEVFRTLNGEIVITFQMEAQVLKLEVPPCDNFQLQSRYSCPVEKQQIKYPIYVIFNVLSANSFEVSHLDKNGLIPLERKSFPFGVCD